MSNSPDLDESFLEVPEGAGLFWPSIVFGVLCFLVGLFLIYTPPPKPDPVSTPSVARETPTSTQSPTPAEGQTEIRFAFVDSKDSTFAFAAEAIRRRLTQATQGRLQVKLMPGGLVDGKKLGEIGLVKTAQSGQITMVLCTTAPLTNLDPALSVLDLPFLFDSHAHVDRVLDGEVGQGLLDGLQKHSLQGLGYLDVGFRIFSSSEPLTKLEDFKGRKLRVMQSAIPSRFVKSIGAEAVPAAVDKIYKMAEEGFIDGADRTYPTYWDFQLYGVHRHIAETLHTYSTKMVLINLDFYQNLPKSDRKLLRSVVREVATLQRQKQREADRKVKEKCLSQGIQIHEYSEAERQKFKAKTKPVYEEFVELNGSEALDAIRAQGDEKE